MERLLSLRLEVQGCRAVALLNELPLLQGQGREVQVLPVHEFALAGANRLELRVLPADPQARRPVSLRLAQPQRAAVQLLLPRMGAALDPGAVRVLAELEWNGAKGDSCTFPLSERREVELAVNFPLWRWCKAPVIETVDAALRTQVAATLRQLAADLDRGDCTSLIELTRLRTEELALAYQRDAAAESARLEAHLQALQRDGGVSWTVPEDEDLVLQPLAGARLLDCQGPEGQPALRSTADVDGVVHVLPLRLAVVAGRIYALR